jgi:hypothetical protein
MLPKSQNPYLVDRLLFCYAELEKNIFLLFCYAAVLSAFHALSSHFILNKCNKGKIHFLLVIQTYPPPKLRRLGESITKNSLEKKKRTFPFLRPREMEVLIYYSMRT